jgi:ribosomal protein S18 acetylase RimI-like enzyme
MFAPFSPQITSQVKPDSLQFRTAILNDWVAIARLLAQRQQGVLEEFRDLATHLIQTGHCWLAVKNGLCLGYGRCLNFIPPKNAPDNCVPAGWYLLGIIVDEEYRRQNIGRALTEFRLNWIQQRSDKVYYFANAVNQTSIRLHAEFGFQPVKEHIYFPGVEFSGDGYGVLFQKCFEE